MAPEVPTRRQSSNFSSRNVSNCGVEGQKAKTVPLKTDVSMMVKSYHLLRSWCGSGSTYISQKDQLPPENALCNATWRIIPLIVSVNKPSLKNSPHSVTFSGVIPFVNGLFSIFPGHHWHLKAFWLRIPAWSWWDLCFLEVRCAPVTKSHRRTWKFQ